MPPRPVDLEPHRDWIVSQIRSGRTLEYIRGHLPVPGASVSTNTLRRRLDAWGIRNADLGEHGERRGARREMGLDEAKPWIIEAYDRWDPLKRIRSDIELRLGIVISERRLQALLHDDWDVPPRRDRAQAPEVRILITTLVESGQTVSQIRYSLILELGLRLSEQWVRDRLNLWDLEAPRPYNCPRFIEADLPAIQKEITRSFFESKQTDADLQVELWSMGFKLSLNRVRTIRKELRLLRRHLPEQADEELEQLREAMSLEPRADILVPRLTKKILPLFFKQEFKLSISREMAWRYLKQQYPEEMLNRIRVMARRRGGYLCPGPNYIWSIDAYCKLAHWGIEVYACIDAYSRYIIWAHVGHTAQTQRSVCLQYMDTIRRLEYLPLIIRSDHGVETGMIAGAHYWLSSASTDGRLLKPTRDDDGNVVWIYREQENGREVRHVVQAGEDENVPPPTYGPHRQLEFHDCYSYGLSTSNQRIESWWQQLNYHITGYWRDVFPRMEREQDWSEFRVADRIALLYVYLPQIHWEIGKFIRAWNAHTIRAQRNRPHVASGIPRNNYFGRDTETRVNCAVAVNPESLGKLDEALEYDRENVSRYLTPDIMKLCEAIMATLDVDDIPPRNRKNPLLHEYRYLRDSLQNHEGRQIPPLLHLARKPTGGWPALDAVVQQTGRSLQDILGEDIADDFDPGLDL